MKRTAQRAADSLAAYVLGHTVVHDEDRPDVLNHIASALRQRASELRDERIQRTANKEDTA